ncbi:MAG: ABC transporter ATP-binding protein [Acidobacteriota bacterium]
MTPTASPAPPLLSFHAIGRSYGRFRALADVDLDLFPGETVAILGGNGAGKTTLLKIAATLLAPTRGHLTVDGQPLRGRTRALHRHSLGFAGHATFLYADLTAAENLLLHARLRGVACPHDEVEALLRRVNLWEWRHILPDRLSRGMQQRASLARALIGHPRLLLLDEPFSGLDRTGTAIVEDLLQPRGGGQSATLLVTHDLPRAVALADRCLILEHGRPTATRRCVPLRTLPGHEVTLQRLVGAPS